jgi:hypothetical protein
MVRRRFLCSGALVLLIIACGSALSQTADKSAESVDERVVQSIAALQAQVDQLNSQLNKMREDEEKLRAEMAEIRKRNGPLEPAESQPSAPQIESYLPVPDITRKENVVSDPMPLDERVDLLEKKVSEQYQTKVESGSKYRVGFTGLVLLNLFANRGNVDSIETPSIAEEIDPIARFRGSIGGTLRQTELGFQVNGPDVFGARTSGNIQFDFSGGLTPAPGGQTMGVVRLRTGTIRLDWQDTSFVAGQDGLFFVPLAPTSYASISQPALSYAGNLWGWVPQVRVEQRLGSSIMIKAGILDPVDDAFPGIAGISLPPGPGEQTRMPGFGTHVGWSHPLLGRMLSFGAGGFYGKQQFQLEQSPTSPPSKVTSWLGSTDWEIPLSRWLILSGSMYRGSAIGGLAGGLGQSVVFTNFVSSTLTPPPDALVKGLNTEGGWSQVKIQPFPKLEWNFAAGDDNPFARQLNSGNAPSYLDAPLTRNRAALGNIIYRPRSDLLLSFEFRHIESYPKQEKRVSANQANLGMGIMF